LQFVILPNK